MDSLEQDLRNEARDVAARPAPEVSADAIITRGRKIRTRRRLVSSAAAILVVALGTAAAVRLGLGGDGAEPAADDPVPDEIGFLTADGDDYRIVDPDDGEASLATDEAITSGLRVGGDFLFASDSAVHAVDSATGENRTFEGDLDSVRVSAEGSEWAVQQASPDIGRHLYVFGEARGENGYLDLPGELDLVTWDRDTVVLEGTFLFTAPDDDGAFDSPLHWSLEALSGAGFREVFVDNSEDDDVTCRVDLPGPGLGIGDEFCLSPENDDPGDWREYRRLTDAAEERPVVLSSGEGGSGSAEWADPAGRWTIRRQPGGEWAILLTGGGGETAFTPPPGTIAPVPGYG
ncbi:hypothetical protein [Salininema proteolyticum]|uniref:Uncharacterized protein n=1 Tax=Salininema proteolyticum TaxID=1607685 RepID=A0ABV8TWD5_9ACTN